MIICYFAVPWVTFKVRNKQLVRDVDRLTEKSPDILKELKTLKKGQLEIQNDLKTTRDEIYEVRKVSQALSKFQSELKQLRKEIEAMQSVSILCFTNFHLKFSLTLWLTYLTCF